ncbi:MAG: tetratricopeptide repeat protein [Planctomycetes bacterium]|nr:tetratricopeptide repeat protein [Planctomycetota bacterium]
MNLQLLIVLSALPLATAPAEEAETTRQLLERGVQLQKQAKYDEAIRVLEECRQQNPAPDLAAEILVDLGQTHFAKGKAASEGKLPGVAFEPCVDESRKVYAEVIERYPQVKESAAIAAYMIGSCHILRGDMAQALNAYQRAYFEFPSETYRPRALVRIGVCLEGIGEAQKALKIYEAYLDQYEADERFKGMTSKVKTYLRQTQIVGRPAPPIQADEWLQRVAPKGGLADLKGEVVVLVFLASWCTNCSSELPHMKREMEYWSRRGVVFLGVADPDDPKSVEPIDAYIRRQEIEFFDVALDRGGKSWYPYRITGLPAAAIVDRSGVLRWRGHFAFIGRTLLEKLVRE